MTYTGLLRSATSQDELQVSLNIEGETLRAREPGGRTWDISLEHVRLIHWTGREIQLELAGEPVSFFPEDPAGSVRTLVAILRPDAGTETPTDRPPTRLRRAEPPSDPVAIDLSAEEIGTPAVPVAPRRPTAAAPAPPPSRRRRRAAMWGALALALAAAALGISTLLGGEGPEGRARQALDDAGLSAVAVDVVDGVATLTGTAASRELSSVAAAAVGELDGIDTVVNAIDISSTASPTTPGQASGTPATGPNEADATAALVAAGIDSAIVATDGSLLVVTGTVVSEADRRAAIAALGRLDGVEQIDDRLTIVTVPDETVATSARTALSQAGYDSLTVTVEDGIATLTGVVPLEVLEGGFFRYSDRAEAIVIEQEGVAGIRNRLQLTGDAATLRRQLRSLTEAAPIIFGLGDAALTEESRATLDEAAAVIQGQPGLRVLIAGHTDTTGSAGFNEQLSQERADAVRRYLIEQGIAANRLVVVAYGELFPTSPGAAPLDRRVEFEVAG